MVAFAFEATVDSFHPMYWISPWPTTGFMWLEEWVVSESQNSSISDTGIISLYPATRKRDNNFGIPESVGEYSMNYMSRIVPAKNQFLVTGSWNYIGRCQTSSGLAAIDLKTGKFISKVSRKTLTVNLDSLGIDKEKFDLLWPLSFSAGRTIAP